MHNINRSFVHSTIDFFCSPACHTSFTYICSAVISGSNEKRRSIVIMYLVRFQDIGPESIQTCKVAVILCESSFPKIIRTFHWIPQKQSTMCHILVYMLLELHVKRASPSHNLQRKCCTVVEAISMPWWTRLCRCSVQVVKCHEVHTMSMHTQFIHWLAVNDELKELIFWDLLIPDMRRSLHLIYLLLNFLQGTCV